MLHTVGAEIPDSFRLVGNRQSFYVSPSPCRARPSPAKPQQPNPCLSKPRKRPPPFCRWEAPWSALPGMAASVHLLHRSEQNYRSARRVMQGHAGSCRVMQLLQFGQGQRPAMHGRSRLHMRSDCRQHLAAKLWTEQAEEDANIKNEAPRSSDFGSSESNPEIGCGHDQARDTLLRAAKSGSLSSALRAVSKARRMSLDWLWAQTAHVNIMQRCSSLQTRRLREHARCRLLHDLVRRQPHHWMWKPSASRLHSLKSVPSQIFVRICQHVGNT